MTDVYIVNTQLTPVGQLNGILGSHSATELCSAMVICGDVALNRVQT